MKQQLRQKKLLERLNQHPVSKKKKEEAINKKLLKLSEVRLAKTILIYVAIKAEVSLEALFDKLLLNKKFVLPKVAAQSKLNLYYTKNLHDLKKGKFGVPEPKSGAKKASAGQIDIALVPGIVFDKNGHRIGYGKGYYDRMLKKLKCPKIGVAYDFQIVDNIAGESHDTPMDTIVTEKKIIRPKKDHS